MFRKSEIYEILMLILFMVIKEVISSIVSICNEGIDEHIAWEECRLLDDLYFN